MAKIFAKFGAKRDENLGDLRSGEAALNILLDRIKGGNESFTVADLNVIQGIFNTNINANTFSSAANATVKVTGPTGANVIYDPLITLQNRFDRAYFTTSEPFFYGGDGLTARYFDDNLILRSGDAKTTFLGFDQVLDETGRATINSVTGVENATQIDQFWEEGEFVYNNKIINKLLSAYGGVEWTGFYKPTSTGDHGIRIITSGFIKVEFDTKEAPSKGFTFDPGTGTFKMDDLDFTSNGMTTLANQTRLNDAGIITDDGFTITGTTILSGQNESYGSPAFSSAPPSGSGASFSVRRDLNGAPIVELVSGGSGYSVGQTFVIAGSSVGGGAGDNITITITDIGGYYVYNDLAGASTNIRLGAQRVIDISLGNLIAYEPYKIKISFFMDEDAVSKTQEIQVNGSLQKYIIFQRNIPVFGLIDEFDYKFLYNEKYFDFYNIGDFKKFIDDSIDLGGTKIGRRGAIGKQTSIAEGSDGDGYNKLANLNPIVSYYTADFGVVSNSVRQKTATTALNSDFITLPNSGLNAGLANKTEGIEVGNYITGPGIPIGSRITSIVLNSGFRIDQICTSTNTNTTIDVIKHEGIVAFGTSGSYSTNIVPSSGYNEDGFSFGTRGINKVKLTSGSLVNLDDSSVNYGSFNSSNYLTNADGIGAVFNISRNAFGALVVTTVSAGSGYSNFEWFVVDGEDIGQAPGEDLTFEIISLTDAFFTGKPQLVIQKDQLFKQSLWSNTFNISNKTIPGFETNGKIEVSSQTAIIDRFQLGATASGLTKNSIVFKDQSLSLTNTGVKWYIYQSFGLNNDGLSFYCQGVVDKRILQKCTIISAGSGYSSNYTPALQPNGQSVTNVPGNTSKTGMRVYYLQSGGSITYAWVKDPGVGYEAGDIVQIDGGTAQLELSYENKSSSSVQLRLPDAKDLQVGMYAHLFPAINAFGPDINNLESYVKITNIDYPVAASGGLDTAALVTLTHEGGQPDANNNVQKSDITYVDSVVTRVTFTPPLVKTNKEVCFRPTDTSPPFSATARGLSTNFDVKLTLDFSSSTNLTRKGVFNTNSRVSYDALELLTKRQINGIPNNELTLTSSDYIGGYLPITAGDNITYYILLQKTL